MHYRTYLYHIVSEPKFGLIEIFMFDSPSEILSFERMRLLIVEDNKDLLRNLNDGIREEGYFVDSAEDGMTALYKLENWTYDCVLMDVMLPEMDGFAVLKKIRERSISTPVLMLTALGGTFDRIKGLDHGADDYLIKPFDFDELLARIRALIRRSVGNSEPILDLGNLQIDAAGRTVEINGEPVELTRQEYALLYTLAQRRGRVVTREFLMERIYDREETVSSNLLDVLIYNVRCKVGKALIQTRRGQGYTIPK